MGSYTTLLSVKNIYILSYFLNIMNWDRTLHYCLSGIFTFVLFLKYNELVSDTTLLSVRYIYILFYFLYIMYRDLHYFLSGIFTFYFIS